MGVIVGVLGTLLTARLNDRAQADAQRTKAWEAVLLLGDADTVAAAREWRWAVPQLERAARGVADDDFDRTAAVRRADEGRDRFCVAARAGLTVGSGDVAQARWLTDRQMNS